MSYAQDRADRIGLTRCPMCPKRSPPIPPDGPPNSPFLFVGAGPGKEDSSRGRCFTGYHSKEFTGNYLKQAGLEREEVRVTNARLCYDEADEAKLTEVTEACANYHLRRTIEQMKPDIIIPMGAVACSLMPDLNINMWHGLPMENTNWYGHVCTTFPMRHPAESMHKTDAMIGLTRDFQALGQYIHGQLEVPVDEYPEPLYEDLGGESDVRFIIDTYGDNIYQWVAIDTETDPTEGFYCLSFSMAHGTGFMIRKENRSGINLLHEWVMDTKGQTVFHNSMFDIPVLEQVGFVTPMKRLDDTMLRSYFLQYLPQALKELGFRLCGVEMTDFEDLVLPFSMDIMVDYIIQLSDVDWPKPEPQQIIDSKTGEFKTYKPQGLNTKLKRLLTDFAKKPDHKIFNRWREWSEEERLPAMAEFGDLPLPSIKYVPKDKQVKYACADADVTGRVRSKLIKLKRGIRHGSV